MTDKLSNTSNSSIAPDSSSGHRFGPGNTAAVGHGRPKKAQELAALNAIRASWPPERIVAALDEAMQVAQTTRSWRGILEVARFVTEYQLGRPTNKVEVDSGKENLAMLLAVLRDGPSLDDILDGAG